jgi:hypothetical protein
VKPKVPTFPNTPAGCVPVVGVTLPCQQAPVVPTPSVPPPPGSWNVQCVLDILCKGDSQDRDVVKKLPRLTVLNREPKHVHYKTFHNGNWVDEGFDRGGSAQGTTIWINNNNNCEQAATTFFHEVTHTDQPASMPDSQREYDAYYKTEEWRIKKGLPPWQPGFQKTVTDPNDPSKTIVVPDRDAIKLQVDKDYGYNPPTPAGGGAAPPAIVGLTPDGTKVKFADGTPPRPPQEGDAYRLPDTGGKVTETIDSSKWKCP